MSILKFTVSEKLFQAALKSRSMYHALNTHKNSAKIKRYSQAFNFQRKTEKSLGNTKMAAVKFDVNRNNVVTKKVRVWRVFYWSVFERYSAIDD